VLINYNEYSHLIGTENFQNIALDTINEVIRKSENLNKEIIILTETMKNKLLAIIVDNDIKIRKDF
jgi:long-subunit acyl-CoA synthetase (AMP-forming)